MRSTISELIDDKLLSILLIDDDEEDYFLTRDIIEDINHKRFTVDWVDNYERGIKIMGQKMHDIYLVDYRLGSHTGLDILQHAIEMDIQSPIILLTGQEDFEIDQLATIKGAADYLVKSEITPDRLERSMRYSLMQNYNLLKIRQLNQDLEARVAARTDALAMAVKNLEKQIKDNKVKEIQLRKSQEELKKALAKEQEVNELKSRFVSMASHEFRTPLATILSSVSLIEKYEKPEYAERRNKHIKRIKSNVHSLNGILDDFLSLSKLEEGKINLHIEPIKLMEMLSDLKEEMNLQTRPGQHIRLDYEEDEAYIWSDGHLIRNSLTNLLSNAIKYSPENTEITIKGRVKGPNITITVQDKGLGIPKEEQEHLFERFFRAKNVTHIKGTGLGLSIVKRYVDMLGGRITFESIPDKGTSFSIHLSKMEPKQ